MNNRWNRRSAVEQRNPVAGYYKCRKYLGCICAIPGDGRTRGEILIQITRKGKTYDIEGGKQSEKRMQGM